MLYFQARGDNKKDEKSFAALINDLTITKITNTINWAFCDVFAITIHKISHCPLETLINTDACFSFFSC